MVFCDLSKEVRFYQNVILQSDFALKATIKYENISAKARLHYSRFCIALKSM